MAKHAKPRIHGRDHEHGGADPTKIHVEDVGTSGGPGGGGIQFDTDPQEGDWLDVHATGQHVHSASPPDDVSYTGISLIADQMIDIVSVGVDSGAAAGVRIITAGVGPIELKSEGGAILITLAPTTGGDLEISHLPTSAPASANRVWRDGSGYLRIGP